MSDELSPFDQGHRHALSGMSIHYNPYRNRGLEASQAYVDWLKGWRAGRNELMAMAGK